MKHQQQQLRQVATNLYRSDTSSVYYAIFKVRRKQIRRSLKTTDKELARRRMEDLRRKVGRLNSSEGRHLPFAEYDTEGNLIGGLAKRWLDITATSIEPSTRDRYLGNIQKLAKHFKGRPIAGITREAVENWAITRAAECAAVTYNKDRDVLWRILEYGVDHGLLLENMSHKIARRTGNKKIIIIPTHEQFHQFIFSMQTHRAGPSADLLQALAYSGCRKSEIVGDPEYGKEPMRWRDINFATKTFYVSPGKNHKSRTVPLFPAFEVFLKDLLSRSPVKPSPDDRIIDIDSAMSAAQTACRRLGFSKFGHHTMRHVFCSNAIEKGVDFKTIAGWVGHNDGGILVAKTYGHLRNAHSEAMAQRMTIMATNPAINNPLPLPLTSEPHL